MRIKVRVAGLAFAFLLLMGVPAVPASARPPEQGPPPPPISDAALLEQLRQESVGLVRVSHHAGTGKIRFVGTSPGRPIARPTALGAGISPEEAARGFLGTYGQLFGLKDQARELEVIRAKSADRGRSFVRFQQVHQGAPVLGGELIIQLDTAKNVVSASGEVLPSVELDLSPQIDAETARLSALGKVARDYGLSEDNLRSTQPELWIYDPTLLGGLGPRIATLVWRMEVTPLELLPIRELVLVDAQRGFVALHFNQIDTAKNRLIYDNQNKWIWNPILPGNGPVRIEGGPETSITDANAAYNYAGDTYDFYFNSHGRDSIDNAGMSLVNTVRYCPGPTSCPYQNAFWDGTQMVYGAGFPQADDVVAHEMTHGVTQYESRLFYYMQSGAINEAFSDIWGEFVDLTNSAGDDSSAVRWQIGEDEPNYGTLRNMSNPPLFDDPDRMTSDDYYCGEEDNGGVHSNSGVANKAAYLMVDGGTFNSYTVTGIGITKVAQIWYEVQTNMFTSAADYQDLYDNLYQACTDLIGPITGITIDDCDQVHNATLATEMDQQPASCPVTHAPLCDSGSPNDLFFDDMENPASGNWTHGAITGNDGWYYPQNDHPYSGWDATYATSGVYNIWGYDQPSIADYYMAMTLPVPLSSGSAPYLHFQHAYAFEDFGTTMYDGGVLEYSTNGGASWNDAGSLFTHNGYNGTIASSWGNPLGGRSGFGGESDGYLSSRLNLSSLAGQNVRFRFRIGTDRVSDDFGWFIDDVHVYTCGNTSPIISGLIDQSLVISTSRDNAIDLWAYTSDAESGDNELIFTIDNTPDPNAGVITDSNRYIDLNPTPGWTGQTDVTIRVTDPDGLSDSDTFSVAVTGVAGCGFSDGFESGNLGTGWTAYTSNEGRVRVGSSYPHSGAYSLLLDDAAGNLTYSYAAAILTLDLSGQSQVGL
ncbi:MAG: M4 family metallopeptidase, partial [Anaerolineales bacterium]